MRRLALLGGVETMRFFQSGGLQVDHKDDRSPVTEADCAADRVIVDGLSQVAPDVPVVTEERVDSHANAAARFFLVDPLDGTKEFVSGKGEFTVNIALIEAGAPVLGAVFAPAIGRLFWTPDRGEAVEETGALDPDGVGALRPLTVATPDNAALRVVASKSHRDAETDAYIAQFTVASLVSAGSSLKFCLLASGEADLYPRFGPTSEWDTAAADAVLRAAGGVVDRAEARGRDGGALRYGKEDILNPAFIAYAPGVAFPS